MKRVIFAALAVAALFLPRRRGAIDAHADHATPSAGRASRAAAVLVRHPWLSLAALGLLAAIGGGLVVLSGVVSISAAKGHWAVTERFLYFAMRRSIATHSIAIEPPALDDPALVLRAAGHYQGACLPCHGGPGTPLPGVPAAMTPHPPELQSRLPSWDPEDLFYIVKHGVKMTGMPAWPSQRRDDEVWAMVAFLRRMPGMTPQEFRRLAGGDGAASLEDLPANSDGEATAVDAPPDVVLDTCARCHGIDGRGRAAGAFPIIGGQRREYLVNALRAYARGARHSGIMQPIATALSDRMVQDAARYYSSRGRQDGTLGPPPAGASDPAAASRGREIASRGIPERKIPACISCHGPADPQRNPAYPILAGQHPRYLAQQLRLLQDRNRGGSAYVRLMHSFVDRLTAQQVRDVAEFFGTQPVEEVTTRR